MKFEIEQIALAINKDREDEALSLLETLGISEWTRDIVVAKGQVFGHEASNTAHLRFNYTALEKSRELEVIRYLEGDNWLMFDTRARVSHIGMHTTEDELSKWHEVLTNKHQLQVVQEVLTQTHNNPVIVGKRWYHYVIYGAQRLIGTDIKFIVRRDKL